MIKDIQSLLACILGCILCSACTGEYIINLGPNGETGFGPNTEIPGRDDDDSIGSDLEYDDEKEQEENSGAPSDEVEDTNLTTGSIYELKSFDISTSETPFSENEQIPASADQPYYDDYVENYSVNNTVEVTWSGTSATFTGATDKIQISQSGNDVTIQSAAKGMQYVLKGKGTDCMISIYSDSKFRLDLQDLSLTNNDGPAINIQSGKRAYVTLKGANTLSDGANYATSAEDRKATFFSEGQLCFSSSGTLNITAKHKNGIASDDYLFFRPGPVINITTSGTNGLKANDYILIQGGVLNVQNSVAGGKAMSSDGYIRINGGRTTLTTSGGVDMTDYSSSCCIKSDSVFVMNKGELYCKSTGQGGKGIKADMNAYFNGGKVRVITTGSDYGSSGGRFPGSSSSSGNTARPKGIRVEGKLFVNGGDIMVRVSSHEGIESKSYIEFNGGRTMIYSYDDAVNSAGDLVINDGYIFSQATKNDGLDSNGNMTFNGGVVVAAGSSSPECGIDVNTEGRAYMTINGGTIIGIGGGNNTPSYGLQCYALYGTSGMGGGGMGGGRPGSGSSSSSSGSVSSGTTYVLTDGKTPALVFKSEVSGSSFLISTPALTKNTSYTLTKGASVSGGDDFCGLVTGATVTGGTTVTTLTAKQP